MTPANRIFLGEYRNLLPEMRRLSDDELHTPTVCTGWTVLDIVAHVGSALGYIARGESYDASPSGNQVEVDKRRFWPAEQILEECERNLLAAAQAAEAPARDGAALGTWIHGGDVRQALALPDAYAHHGNDDALALLQITPRVTATPGLTVQLPQRTITLGNPELVSPDARLECDVATLFCLYSGRPVDPDRYRLTGRIREELVSAQW